MVVIEEEKEDEKETEEMGQVRIFAGIYYINLDKRTDRRELIEKELDALGLLPHATRISACENKEAPFMGCTKSHLKALKVGQRAASKNDGRCIMIFEDDFERCPDVSPADFSEAIQKAMQSAEWGILSVGCTPFLIPCDQIMSDEACFSAKTHLLRLSQATCAHCYIVKVTFIPILIDIFEQALVARQPLDVTWQLRMPNLPWYTFLPPICRQRTDLGSDISPEHIGKLNMQEYAEGIRLLRDAVPLYQIIYAMRIRHNLKTVLPLWLAIPPDTYQE